MKQPVNKLYQKFLTNSLLAKNSKQTTSKKYLILSC